MKSPWLLRLLALAGFVLSAYLLVLKLTGRINYLAGCGEGSGCDNVLGSRWSQFFHVPITAFSAGMYAVLLVATWKPSRLVYAGLAVCFVGAAVWFYGILLFVLKDFCPYCIAAHLIGVACAVLLFLALKRKDGLEGSGRPGALGGIAGLAVLILGQVFGPVPDTHAVSEGAFGWKDEAGSIHAQGGGRTVTFFGGKTFHPASLPHLGSPDAPQVAVKYFDFTCEACLEMHRGLEAAMRKHPGELCIVMLPVPLNTACNEFYPEGNEEAAGACELARFALAGWRAMPEAYPEVHEILFTRPILEPEIAEIAVAQIVGEEAFAAALKDPWVEGVLATNCKDFGKLQEETIKMPKLIYGKDRLLHGVTKTPEVLMNALEDELGL